MFVPRCRPHRIGARDKSDNGGSHNHQNDKP